MDVQAPIDAAHILYGSPPKPDAPEPTADRSDEHPLERKARMAEVLYGKPATDEPPARHTEDSTEPEAKGFEPTDEALALRANPGYVVDDEVNAMVKDEAYVEILGEEQGHLAAAEVRAVCNDLCLQAEDLTEIGTAIQAAHDNRYTDSEREQMRTEGIALVYETFGARAGEAIAAAKALVARDPRVKALMNTTGIGDDPQVILRFARAGMTARNRGLLK